MIPHLTDNSASNPTNARTPPGVDNGPGSTPKTTEFGHAARIYGTTGFRRRTSCSVGVRRAMPGRSDRAIRLIPGRGPSPTWSLLPLLLGDSPIDGGE